MTARADRSKRKGNRINKQDTGRNAIRALSTVISIGLLLVTALVYSDELSAYALDGLRAVALKVLPTSLPFMILSEFFTSRIYPESLSSVRWLVGRLFALPPAAIAPIVIGNLAGFPVGAKLTVDLYRAGRLDLEGARRCIALSSNPSPAFVIATVGVGILGDKSLGEVLLLSLLISTLLTALIFRGNRRSFNDFDDIVRQNYDFVSSVRGVATALLSTSAFIVAFYTLSSFISASPLCLAARAIIILPLEVTGAVLFIGKVGLSSNISTLALMGFALGFGGLSVACQVSALTKGTDITIKKYLPMKLVQGLISAGIAALGGIFISAI